MIKNFLRNFPDFRRHFQGNFTAGEPGIVPSCSGKYIEQRKEIISSRRHTMILLITLFELSMAASSAASGEYNKLCQ